jgi:hypothetical protein
LEKFGFEENVLCGKLRKKPSHSKTGSILKI